MEERKKGSHDGEEVNRDSAAVAVVLEMQLFFFVAELFTAWKKKKRKKKESRISKSSGFGNGSIWRARLREQ